VLAFGIDVSLPPVPDAEVVVETSCLFAHPLFPWCFSCCARVVFVSRSMRIMSVANEVTTRFTMT
jgi:hypothetical protein